MKPNDVATLAADGEPTIGQVVSFLEQAGIPITPEECKRTFPETKVSFDFFSGRSDASFELSVERDLDRMRAVMDPQNWSTCSPKLWIASYPIQDPGTGPIDWSKYPPPLPGPPLPGSTWSGILFEHVWIDGGAAVIQFEVALDIDSKAASSSHDVAFGLRRSIMSALGKLEVSGGIKTDKGTILLRSEAATGSTSISATKEFQLEGLGDPPIDYLANLMAAVSLEQMGDEGYEAVCCTP